MNTGANRQVRLKARPSGIPQAEHFEILEAPVPEAADGQILVRNLYLSVEPAMRGWVSSVGNYSEPVALGDVMRAFTVGRVVASRCADFRVGEIVTGMFGWQDYAAVDSSKVQRRVTETGLPVSTALGVLGLNGLTAYFALLDLGQPKANETVLVSTAAGAVGSCAGQIAKIKGCRTIGVAGGAQKVELCRKEFGYDIAIDYLDRYPEGLRALGGWVTAGLIRYREDILEGIEHAPDSIAGLYRGENLGKRLIRIAREQ